MMKQAGYSVTEAALRRTLARDVRRSQLSLTVAAPPHVSRFVTTSDYYALLIRNTGNKTSREVYWRILLPEDSRNLQAAGGRDCGPLTLDGVVYRQLAGSCRRPIFPTRSSFIVTLKVARADGERPPLIIRWALVSEDGRVPEDETTYASLLLDLPSTHQ
jgi:hypothetical protein